MRSPDVRNDTDGHGSGDGDPSATMKLSLQDDNAFSMGTSFSFLGIESGRGLWDYLPEMIGADRLMRLRDVSISPWQEEKGGL